MVVAEPWQSILPLEFQNSSYLCISINTASSIIGWRAIRRYILRHYELPTSTLSPLATTEEWFQMSTRLEMYVSTSCMLHRQSADSIRAIIIIYDQHVVVRKKVLLKSSKAIYVFDRTVAPTLFVDDHFWLCEAVTQLRFVDSHLSTREVSASIACFALIRSVSS